MDGINREYFFIVIQLVYVSILSIRMNDIINREPEHMSYVTFSLFPEIRFDKSFNVKFARRAKEFPII